MLGIDVGKLWMLDLVENGRFSPNHHLIFLHTGSFPGLWAYEPHFYRKP
jgi:1-aminocyclopropane-1-carboxylate deaminase/D-cysteine desulfhydrase-like pyridoxal-dependent ACC family enzyme